MHNENYIIRKGKRLAFLLRHDKEAFEQGKIDDHGWRMVEELARLGFTRELLDVIVATNNKQRYEYSPDGKKIRAARAIPSTLMWNLPRQHLPMCSTMALPHGFGSRFTPRG